MKERSKVQNTVTINKVRLISAVARNHFFSKIMLARKIKRVLREYFKCLKTIFKNKYIKIRIVHI